jgi:hypothetical protein
LLLLSLLLLLLLLLLLPLRCCGGRFLLVTGALVVRAVGSSPVLSARRPCCRLVVPAVGSSSLLPARRPCSRLVVRALGSSSVLSAPPVFPQCSSRRGQFFFVHRGLRLLLLLLPRAPTCPEPLRLLARRLPVRLLLTITAAAGGGGRGGGIIVAAAATTYNTTTAGGAPAHCTAGIRLVFVAASSSCYHSSPRGG